MPVSLRPALADDVDRAVPLIYSSGPAAFDFVFGDAQAFLRNAFVDGGGEFGYRNHTVAVDTGVVVGIGASYTGERALGFTLTAARQVLTHHGNRGVGVMARGIRIERLIPPPTRSTQYLAHLGVHRALRGSGVGTHLIEHFLQLGRERDRRTAELDVAVTNPRAQALYERLGFEVKEERMSGIPSVPDHRRMVLDL